jgi:hypothetical protein
MTLNHRVPGSSPVRPPFPRGIGNRCDMNYCCRLASRSRVAGSSSDTCSLMMAE